MKRIEEEHVIKAHNSKIRIEAATRDTIKNKMKLVVVGGLLLSALLAPPAWAADEAAKVGDEVCAEGYIMDTYCITETVLFDNPTVETLSTEGPVVHSVKCLVDPPQCPDSGFEVLPDLAQGADTFCRNFRIDQTETPQVVSFIETTAKAGACNNCNNTSGTVESGMRATFKGTVTDAGNKTYPATIGGNVEILDSAVGCGDMMSYSMAALECLGTEDGEDGGSTGPEDGGATSSGTMIQQGFSFAWLSAVAAFLM